MSQRKKKAAASADGASPHAAPSHTRQWTHTTFDGTEQRLHRRETPAAVAEADDADAAMAEANEAEPAAAAAVSASPRSDRRAAVASASSDPAAADDDAPAAAETAPAAADGSSDAPKPNRKIRRMQRLGLSYPEPDAASAPAKKTKAQQSKQKQQRQKPAAAAARQEQAQQQQLPQEQTMPSDVNMQAAAAATVESAVPAASAQSLEPEFPLLSLVQQLAQYGPGPADAAAAAAAAAGLAMPTPPFELFSSVVAHLRAEIQKGETHLTVPVDSAQQQQQQQQQQQNPQPPQQQEDGTITMADADAATSAPSPAAATTSFDLRSLLHRTRIHFARSYPLPPSSWLEWLEDVQSLGSGAGESGAAADAALDEDAEAIEARQDAEAAQEQLFLVSLFRLSLTDYASPLLWDAFLSYVARAIDSVLRTPRAVAEFRALTRAAIYLRGVLEEQRKRAAEKKAAARAKKEVAAASSGAASASKKGSATKPKQKKKPESKEDDDGMDDDAAADDDESSSDDEDAEDSDDSDDEWSDAEDESAEDEDGAQQSEPSVFAPGRLHSCFLPLLSGPFAAADPRALPAPIPLGYSFVDGDALFQKLRSIEMALLTRMMQQMKRQQEDGGSGSADPRTHVHEADLMSQMDRLSRLYRVQLRIPLRPSDLDATFQAFEDWQRKAGNDPEPEVREEYEYQIKVAKALEKKFEATWTTLNEKGQISSGVGTVTPQAAELFSSYLSFLSDSAKARKRCKSNPSQLFSVCERIVSVAFLDAKWWGSYLDLAEQFSGRNAESLLGQLELARRALRNCPWDARIFAGFVHALEAVSESDASLDLAAVETEIEAALNKQSSVARLDVLVESRLEVVGFYRRAVLSKAAAQGGVPLRDVQRVRSAFETIASMLPGLPGFLQPPQLSELVSRVYRIWVELECSYLIHPLSDSLDEEAQGWHDDAQASAEVVARKAGVSVRTYRARQIFQQYIDVFGAATQSWLDWTTFEVQSLATCTEASEVESLLSFIRGLFRQAVERITSVPGFDAASYPPLHALAPVLRAWLDFEMVHAGSLPHLQSAQRRCAKYLDALKPLQAQMDQAQSQGYAQSWNAGAAAAGGVAQEDEAAPVAWFNKPASSNKKGTGKSADKKAKGKGKEKGNTGASPAAAASVTVDAPAVAAAAAGGKKKRKRDEEKEGDATAAAPSDENAAKKSHTGDAAASASTAAASSAAAAAALAEPAPHTAFVLHLPWTLREPELRALFSPFGPVVRLAAHRAATKPNAPRHPAYVEVQFESEEAAQALQAGLQGKEMYGKKIGVVRARPTDDAPAVPAPAAAASSSAAPASSAAASASVSFDETDPLSVFVKNLPRDSADLPAMVRAHFQDCGEIKSVEIPQAHPTAAAGSDAAAASSGAAWRNFGSIYFATAEGATAALAKNLSTLGSTVIGVVRNQAPARRKIQAQKMAVEKKRHPAPSGARLQFVPRATAVTAIKAHEPAAAAAPAEPASAAPTTVNSNSDFRAMLLASKRG